MAPTYVADTGQTQTEANSDTFSMTLIPSTAADRVIMVHYWAPSWVGGINSCTFDSIPGFKIHNADEHDGGYKPIRHEVWAIMNPTSSTAAKTFRASCSKTYHGASARINITAYSGASIDSANFYANDTTTEDASTSISVTTPADSSAAILVFGVAKSATSLTGDTAEAHHTIVVSNGWGFHGRAIGSSSASTFVQDGDHAARILWSAQLLPPQNVTVDAKTNPISAATSAKVGTVDDGNIAITPSDQWVISSSITIGAVQEFEPIEADMFMQKY